MASGSIPNGDPPVNRPPAPGGNDNTQPQPQASPPTVITAEQASAIIRKLLDHGRKGHSMTPHDYITASDMLDRIDEELKDLKKSSRR